MAKNIKTNSGGNEMKIITVESCEKCPYAYHVWGKQYFCKEPTAESKTILNGEKIPKWCPLKETTK